MASKNISEYLNIDSLTAAQNIVETKVEKSKRTNKRNLIPAEQESLFPLAEDIVRPELNISKFASFIFLSPRSPAIHEKRTMAWSRKDARASLSVIPANVPIKNKDELRSTTLMSQALLIVLIQIWEKRGTIDGQLLTSGREIFSILGVKAGKTSYQQLKRELLILQGVSLRWEYSFIDTKNGDVCSGIKQTSFLSTVSYSERKRQKKEEVFSSSIYIVFDKNLLQNLNDKITKPFLFKTFLSISSYDARRLYNALDIFLGSKLAGRPWKRNAEQLIAVDLGIESVRYQYKRIRKQKLQELQRHLDGVAITQGTLAISISENASKTDWQLIAKKHPLKKIRAQIQTSGNPPEIIDDLMEELYKIGFPKEPSDGHTHSLSYTYASHFPFSVVDRALSVYRADSQRDPKVKNRLGIFTTHLHREAHRAGLEWINTQSCPSKDTCSHNPYSAICSQKTVGT